MTCPACHGPDTALEQTETAASTTSAVALTSCAWSCRDCLAEWTTTDDAGTDPVIARQPDRAALIDLVQHLRQQMTPRGMNP